ncbi:MAG TPA: MFS transporter [Syntrophomonadaceae bacterium]|nr:MFS transporter [Syntrophomonadaceae bacterium]
MKIAWKKLSTPLALFALASLMMGAYSGLYDPSFNNYLAQVHHVSEVARGGLEFPRELPGFLVVFVFTALAFLPDTRIAMVSALLVGVSLWGQGYLAPNMSMVVVWMLMWSTGTHLYMALSSSIGLRLAEEGREGRRLGQLGSFESLGSLMGMALVYWGASRLHFSFGHIFAISGSCALLAAICLFAIKPEPLKHTRRKLIFKKQYKVYYLLNILFGARKQIFLTFAPWVLITMFHCRVATFALLGFTGTVLSLVFRPWLGRAIDAWGERNIIATESLLLIIICVTYGFAPQWLSAKSALIAVMICYVSDQLLFSVRIARSTYLNKIAITKEDIAPTISMGLTLDHAVSMVVPFWGGLLWARFGFQWVFLAAAFIAVLNLFASALIKDIPVSSSDNN